MSKLDEADYEDRMARPDLASKGVGGEWSANGRDSIKPAWAECEDPPLRGRCVAAGDVWCGQMESKQTSK